MSTEAAPADQAAETKKPEETPYAALRGVLGLAAKPADTSKKPDGETPKPAEAPKEATKQEAKQDPQPEQQQQKEEKPNRAPVEASEPEKVKRVQKPAQVVRIEGAEELGRLANELRKNAERAVKQETKPEELPELPDHLEKADLEALEELFPEKYKGIEAKARKFWGKGGMEDAYRSKWEADHPGSEYDPDAEEHAKFYRDNEPYVTEAELKKASRHALKKEVLSESKKAAVDAVDPVAEETANARAREAAKPTLLNLHTGILREAVKAADPESADADILALETEHPLLFKTVVGAYNQLSPVVEEIAALKAGARFNPKSNKVHAAIDEAQSSMEQQIESLPEDARRLPIANASGQIIGYKRFVSRSEFQKASQRDQAGMWCVNNDLLLAKIGGEFSSLAAGLYQQEAEKIRTFGGTVGRKKSQQGSGKKNGETAVEPAKTGQEPKSPDIGSQTPTPPSGGEGNGKVVSHKSLRELLGVK